MSGAALLTTIAVGAGAGLLWAPIAGGLVECWPASGPATASLLRAWVGAMRSRVLARAVAVGCVGAGAFAAALAGLSFEGLAALVLSLVLVPVVAIDIERQLIPDVVVLPAAATAMVLGAFAQPGRWWLPAAWAATASGAILIMWLISPSGIGLGDAKLALLLGAALGGGVVLAMAVAFVLGGLAGVWLLITRGLPARTLAVPFGPFLAVGAVLVLAQDGWAWA